MDSFKSITVLALLALGGVDASQSRDRYSRRSSPAPLSVLRSGSLASCSFVEPSGDPACNVQGDAGDLGSVVSSGHLTLPDCAAFCASVPDCKSFSINQDQLCEGFSNSLPLSNTRQDDRTNMFWYDNDCFRCNNGDRILDVNFEYTDVESWSLESDDLDAWGLDIWTPSIFGTGTTKALRIMEIKPEGTVTASLAQDLNLQAGTTYKFAFTGKTTYIPMAAGHVDWTVLTFTISGSSENAYSGPPANGIEISKGWRRFESQFTVEEGQAGSNFLSIDISASGLMLDWFIDDLLIWTV